MPAPTRVSAFPELTAAEADQSSLGWPVDRFSISNRTWAVPAGTAFQVRIGWSEVAVP